MHTGFECPVRAPLGFLHPYEMVTRYERPGPEVVRTPMRMLQCASISDDFYSSLLEWSRDIIYYAVENCVHAYNFHSAEATVVLELPGTTITAVKYNPQSGVLCLGTGDGTLVLVDPVVQKAERYACHRARIGALELFGGSVITGSRDRRARIFDLRAKASVGMFTAHFQEVYGLALSSAETHLASGGNDNRAFVYDLRSSIQPLAKLGGHRAAVKALSWAPESSSRLLTGGGTADKTIRMWDISTSPRVTHSRAFDSQICNLRWLRDDTALATFGYSNDDIKLLSGLQVTRRFVYNIFATAVLRPRLKLFHGGRGV